MRKIPEAGECCETATLQLGKACRYSNMKLPQDARGDVKVLCVECLKIYLLTKRSGGEEQKCQQEATKHTENKKPTFHITGRYINIYINTVKKPFIKDQMGWRKLEGREYEGEERKTKRTFCSSWKYVQTEVASFIKNLLQAVNQLCQSAVVNQIIELFHIWNSLN